MFRPILCALVLMATPAFAADDLKKALSGKSLTNDSGTITLRRNGKIKAKRFEGAWTVRDGKFCRTITKPEKIAGTECQEVKFEGKNVTFISPSGRVNTYVMK